MQMELEIQGLKVSEARAEICTARAERDAAHAEMSALRTEMRSEMRSAQEQASGKDAEDAEDEDE